MEVVALVEDDWRRWRALRQAALAQAPEAFGSTLAEWTGEGDTEQRWRRRLREVPHDLVLVLDGRDVGMVSLTEPDGPEPPEVIGMWIAPEARGSGVGDAAVEAVLAVAAKACPGRAVALSVYADNEPARRLYARHGFVDAGPSPDGEGELRMVHRPMASSEIGSRAVTTSPPPVRPFVVGIVGGGQLARMMYEASIGLGISIALLAEGPDVSAAQVVHDVTVGDYTDRATLRAFAERCDVITFDHEHVPTGVLRDLEAAGVVVRPGPDALVHAQDKVVMRDRLSAAGVPCPAYRVVADADALRAFGDETGWPVIAKTSRGGYDGKGVWKIDTPEQADEPFAALGGLSAGAEILAEEYVDFVRELSALVVRSPSGQAVAYPVSESVQRNGICVETTTPAPGLTEEQAVAAEALALQVAGELGVVGVLAVELMERRDGTVVVNELAMRPHNTGHWSIDGAHTSQFENHLRAVLDLPLGDPGTRDPWTVMANVLGGTEPDLPSTLLHCFARDRRLRVQLYGKEVEPGRKVGHVTAYGDDLVEVRRRARHAAGYLMGDPDA